MREQVQFGSKTIDFQLEFSNRKTLGITVTPDMEVVVKAPVNSPIHKVKEKVKGKATWIIRQQSYFLNFHPKTPVKKYIGGETHLYLGRQYRLKVTDGEIAGVKLKGKYIEVTRTPKSADVKHLVDEWYLGHALQKFKEYAQPHIENFKKYNVEPKGFVIRQMPTRWGSCTSKGKIILNPELIKAPKGCIEYVIVHELCHLIHHDHTQRFIELQTKEFPKWEKWKHRLETLLA